MAIDSERREHAAHNRTTLEVEVLRSLCAEELDEAPVFRWNLHGLPRGSKLVLHDLERDAHSGLPPVRRAQNLVAGNGFLHRLAKCFDGELAVDDNRSLTATGGPVGMGKPQLLLLWRRAE